MRPETAPGRTDAWRDVVEQRHSCRAFTDEVLDDDLLAELFALAQRTPSWCNAQPWQVDLVTGPARHRLAAALEIAYDCRPPQWDIEPPVEYLGAHQCRRQEAGAGLYRATGVNRYDMAGRVAQMRRNFEFFGAPQVAVISVGSALGEYALVDAGGFMASVLWSAEFLGVAAIAQAAPARHSDLIRGALGIADDHLVIGCIALGRADPDHQANQFRTGRAAPDEVLRMHRT